MCVCVCVCVCVCMCARARTRAQSCLTLCDPMDCSLPGSSVCEIFQARILEWAAVSRYKGLNLHLLCLLNWQADSLSLPPETLFKNPF